ncbi:RtcB family protein [Candidatus Berkiella aquae]|uniref:3'-phosphate/5'-hydroxy nucleic acid ligase n=1 Tax=Candidatus Berkiella aquae TaxID=295108 RepID=A0A0Q9YVZ4_9GAMM|nr:RtcB family protein [Candidatus Berkiella aquae]MCS5711261.1 RtcB family protein [Candidatus Berkiella aquae]
MPVKKIINEGKVPVKIYTDEIDDSAYRQLCNISQLDIIHSHVAAMPDVHCGIGATVGSVIPTKKAIIPAAVGVDIGCGMQAIRLSLKAYQLPNNLKNLRLAIEEKVPVGFDAHGSDDIRINACMPFKKGIDAILETHPQLLKIAKNIDKKWMNQLGTLGGGNHFIELCLDEQQHVWVMLHSGSRGIGNAIGTYFIDLAKKDMGIHLKDLPDKDLAYLQEGTQHFQDYVTAVQWAQDYAYANRQEMMNIILEVLRGHLPPFAIEKEAINCHHNYVAIETHFGESVYVTRKGAIRAEKGDLGIIPGSMGACSYIVRGKGNKTAFHSCAHGAGRLLSRNEARRRFQTKDLIAQTKGVECRKDKQVLDEIPSAYKNIDTVMENQSDLVEVLYQLKQIICIKG